MTSPAPKRLRLPTAASALAVLCVVISTAHAILINGEGPTNTTGIYDRFNVGTYPGAPVDNPSFIGASLDLSGVGWASTDPNRSITLVSSRYFVGASHYMPAVGSTLQFLGTDNILYFATVQSYQALTYTGTNGAQASDLSIGRLTASLPSSVTPMPVFYLGTTDVNNPSSFNAYDGLSLYNYGWTARMGTNTLDFFAQYSLSATPGTNIGLVYDKGAGAGETLLEGGDSGSPTLAYFGSTYGLIGTHSGVDTQNLLNVDAFVSYTSYVNQMNAIMAADNQSLTLVGVPEPGTCLVGLALLGLCGAKRMRLSRNGK